MISGNIKWYAIYTKSKQEKKIHAKLLENSIEAYLPLNKQLKQWSDRKKWVEEPLIRSYLFVRINRKDYFNILNIPGIVKFISFSEGPVIIPDYQIESLKRLLSGGTDLEILDEYFEPGDPVEIIAGNLLGLTGELIKYKGIRKIIIRIDHLEQSLLINIPSNFLRRKSLALAN